MTTVQVKAIAGKDPEDGSPCIMVGVYHNGELYDCGAWDDCADIRLAVQDYSTFALLNMLGKMRMGSATPVAQQFNQQADNVLLWSEYINAEPNPDHPDMQSKTRY